MNYLEYDYQEYQFGIYYEYQKGLKGDYYQPDDDDKIDIDKIVLIKYTTDDGREVNNYNDWINFDNILHDSVINNMLAAINEDVIQNQYYL
tara:strand:+ start:1002 stop:1274 length:273 start_codon:yes stop_codon:yes gene_type:complete